MGPRGGGSGGRMLGCGGNHPRFKVRDYFAAMTELLGDNP